MFDISNEHKVIEFEEFDSRKYNLEWMKQLLAGDPCSIKRKYYDEIVYINNCPIIIISNYPPPPLDVAFENRVQVIEANVPLQGIVAQATQEATTVVIGDIDSD